MNPDFVMKVHKIEEAGYKSAMEGLSYNKKQPIENMSQVATRLAPLDRGHNKFLEHIEVWFRVEAPRYWWQEADTYRLSSKSSESTMHTLIKELKTLSFEEIANMHEAPKEVDFNYIDKLISLAEKKAPIYIIKRHLSEGFIQKRMWKMSYKTIRNIYTQRYAHTLPHWKSFCDQVLGQIEHPELITRNAFSLS